MYPANRHKAVSLTAKEFRYSFGNALSEEESNALYERWTIPFRVTACRRHARIQAGAYQRHICSSRVPGRRIVQNPAAANAIAAQPGLRLGLICGIRISQTAAHLGRAMPRHG